MFCQVTFISTVFRLFGNCRFLLYRLLGGYVRLEGRTNSIGAYAGVFIADFYAARHTFAALGVIGTVLNIATDVFYFLDFFIHKTIPLSCVAEKDLLFPFRSCNLCFHFGYGNSI